MDEQSRAELLRRLSRLTYVTDATRSQAVAGCRAAWGTPGVHTFLTVDLAIAEEIMLTVDLFDFQRQWDEYRQNSSQRAWPTSREGWFQLADQRGNDLALCLFCLGNYFSLPGVDVAPSPNSPCFARIHLTNCLCSLGRPDQGVALLEQYLSLTPDIYTDDQLARTKVTSFRNRGNPPEIVNCLVASLGECLQAAGRWRDASSLLCVALELSLDVFSQPEKLARQLDLARASLPAKLFLTTVILLANVFSQSGQFKQAAAILRGLMGPPLVDWDSENSIRGALTEFVQRFESEGVEQRFLELAVVQFAHNLRIMKGTQAGRTVLTEWATALTHRQVEQESGTRSMVGRVVGKIAKRFGFGRAPEHLMAVNLFRCLWTEATHQIRLAPWLAQSQRRLLLDYSLRLPGNVENWDEMLPVSDSSSQKMEQYVGNLAFTESVFNAIGDHGFLQFWVEQAKRRSLSEIMEGLGFATNAGEDAGDPRRRPDWMMIRRECQGHAAQRLYVLANLLADPEQATGQSERVAALRLLAIDLGAIGCHLEAIRIWSEILDQPITNLAQPELLIPRIVAIGADKDTQMKVACELVASLWNAGRGAEALGPLIGIAKIDLACVADEQELVKRVCEYTEGCSEFDQVLFAFFLSEALKFGEWPKSAMAMARLGLGLDPLASPTLNETDRTIRLLERQGTNGGYYFTRYLHLLRLFGWNRIADALGEAFLGISNYRDLSHLNERFSYLRQTLSPDNAASCVSELRSILLRSNRVEDAVRVLLCFAGLQPADLADTDSAAAIRRRKLTAFRQELRADTAIAYICALADVLNHQHAGTFWWGAFYLLQTYSGLDQTTGLKAQPTRANLVLLRQFLSTVSPVEAAVFAIMLATAEGNNGQMVHAAKWLEGFIGIKDDDYQKPELLRAVLAPLRQVVGDDNFFHLATQLAVYRFNWDGMSGGRVAQEATANFVDAIGFDFLSPDVVESVQIYGIGRLLEIWLRVRGTQVRDRAMEVCRAVIRLIRVKLSNDAVSLEERNTLVRWLSPIRHLVVRTGHYWLGQAILQESSDINNIRLEVLCWDAELGHRQLLERLAQTHSDSNLFNRDGLTPDVVLESNQPSCPEPLVVTGSDPSQLCAFQLRRDSGGSGGFRENVPLGSRKETGYPEPGWNQPVQEQNLARAIGSSLFLRVGFDRAGGLVWSLFKGNREQLHALSSNYIGTTATGLSPLQKIRDAQERHNREIRQAWDTYADIALSEKWRQTYRDAINGKSSPVDGDSIREFTNSLAKASWEDCQGYWRDLLVSLIQIDAEKRGKQFLIDTWTDLRKYLSSISLSGNDLLAAYLHHQFVEMQGLVVTDRHILLIKWQELTSQPDDARIGAAQAELVRTLDLATETFLRDVQSVWDITPLSQWLTEQIDLIVQVEDALHSVPIAFMAVEGKYLFQYVRSVQASLSPLVNDWLRQVDKRITPNSSSRLMTISWVPPDDPAIAGTRRLHGLQRELATRIDAEWFSASETPPGRHDILAATLGQIGEFPVVTVCGHGVELRPDVIPLLPQEEKPSIPAGVDLEDGRWTGAEVMSSSGDIRSSCELSGIEFLILVSCSIGRLAQSELKDAEGFCLELTVNRARSVLAGLWELHSQHAPEFATWVAEEYFKLRKKLQKEMALGGNTSVSGLRGLATNLARMRWLHEVKERTTDIGINTVAAFQLFGLP